jgi:hypothetical protein
VLLHFEGQLRFAQAGNFEINRNGVVNARQSAGEFNIDDRPDDLDDFAFIHCVSSDRLPKRAGNLRIRAAICQGSFAKNSQESFAFDLAESY